MPGGKLIFIYQNGTAGLVYHISTDGGQTWGAARVIDSDIAAYASAVVNPTTKDVHLVYSNHGDPSGTGSDESVFYRPLLYDSVTADWALGGEQRLAGGGGLYDPEAAGRRNASISTDATGRLTVTYLRNEAGVASWAALVSQTPWSTADMDVDVEIGLIADEDSRGAAQRSTASGSDILFMVSRTGSTYSLAYAPLANPLSSIDVTTVSSTWLGDAGEMVAVAYATELDRLGIIYLRNSKPHFRLYFLGASPALISDTEIATSATQSVSITWDGSRFWLAWVASDIVRVSNSDAPTVVVQTFTNPEPDEDWSWLNSAVSERESLRIVFVWAQTNGGGANRIYVGSFATSRALSGAETGAGADSMKVGVTIAETGAGADTMSAYELKTASDAGAGVDAISMAVRLADAGAGVDVVGKGLNEEETGAGADSMVIRLTVAETGSGADTLSVEEITGIVDTGAGVDSVALRNIIADSGSGELSASIGQQVSEAGAGADSMMLNFVQAETGVGADDMQIHIILNDSGAGVDAMESVDKGNQETGVGVDSVTVGVLIAETGAGADAISATVPLRVVLSDSGAGVDSVAKIWIPTATVIRLLFSGGEVRLKVES